MPPRPPLPAFTAILAVTTALLAAASLARADDAARHLEPFTIEGATSYHHVRYLPDWRYSDDLSPRRDFEMVMDIHVPDDGRERHPVLFVVHGGGWGGGTKNAGPLKQAMTYFTQRGFVCVGFNYILRPRGIFPQVFWDYHDAARFLRNHAEQYKIDPAAFGAIGYSAGGWLISSAGHGSGDLMVRNHQHSTSLIELAHRGWSQPAKRYEDGFLRVMQNPAPAYPGTYGRFQAISMDFQFRIQYASGNTPAFNRWGGKGLKGKPAFEAAIVSGEFDYVQTKLTHPKYSGAVHIPPLFEARDKDGRNLAGALSPDGTREVDAIEVIHAFFQDQLVDNPRTPMPEVWPAWRVVEGPTTVRLVMPAIEHAIRYHVAAIPRDAQGRPDPDAVPPPPDADDAEAWLAYDGPFEVAPDRVVYAIATSAGRRPSTVAEAHFLEGPPVPKVTAPDVFDLPKATTGQPYAVDFDADLPQDQQRWFLQGDLIPHIPWKQTNFVYPNGMTFNQRAGVWSGTPDTPGRYWVQVWVNDGSGRVAGYRDYRWVVEGDDLSPGEDAPAALEDEHIELVYLTLDGKSRVPQMVMHALNA